jgi:hypothetical protein
MDAQVVLNRAVVCGPWAKQWSLALMDMLLQVHALDQVAGIHYIMRDVCGMRQRAGRWRRWQLALA